MRSFLACSIVSPSRTIHGKLWKAPESSRQALARLPNAPESSRKAPERIAGAPGSSMRVLEASEGSRNAPAVEIAMHPTEVL